jgi:hypothetical protein
MRAAGREGGDGGSGNKHECHSLNFPGDHAFHQACDDCVTTSSSQSTTHQ